VQQITPYTVYTFMHSHRDRQRLENQELSPVVVPEKDDEMRNTKQNACMSTVYDSIRSVRMSDHQRERALVAAQRAESIADAMVWLRNRFAALGNLFPRPSLKH
jgi:hypothetical protein